jgi:hypothetical protein
MKRILASLLFATSLPAMAQIYMYTDAQGNTAYTNDPPENVVAQPVNVPPTNTMADTPEDSAADQSSTDTPAPAPANTPQASSTTTIHDDSDADNSDGGYSYDNQQELRDDVDVRRAAAIDAATPGPARIDTPAVDAVVPGPGKIEEGVRR